MQDEIDLKHARSPGYHYDDGVGYFLGGWVTAQLTTQTMRPVYGSQPTITSPYIVDFSQLQRLDTNGACLINQFLIQLRDQGIDVVTRNLPEDYQHLLDLISENESKIAPTNHVKTMPTLAWVGQKAIEHYQQLLQFFEFIGELSLVAWLWIKDPRRIRWIAVFDGIDSTGYRAMPIVALLSFLIGVVLCYQMGIQLANYGASIYVVDLLGLSILREFGPLITAIIIAGRTGSAFAAQLGTMKLNQEIDALNTMGLSPIELLVLPRVTALCIALPLLSVLAICAGLMGGMYMAKVLFNITYLDFISRFGEVIEVKTLVLGMIKTPVFAILIASIGCFQGFRVSGSAASVGEHTTISVVQSIFMIIVADAVFSIIYSKLGV